jgi:hypothetical protein
MKIREKIRAAFRNPRILGWGSAGLFVLAGILFFAGTRPSGPTVTGMVRLDDEPLRAGSIRFVPVKGTSGPDGGSDIHEGKYRIDKGLTVGRYRVEIQGTRKVSGKKMRNTVSSEILDNSEEAIVFAAQDQSREVDVGPGPNPRDFDLKRAKKGK